MQQSPKRFLMKSTSYSMNRDQIQHRWKAESPQQLEIEQLHIKRMKQGLGTAAIRHLRPAVNRSLKPRTPHGRANHQSLRRPKVCDPLGLIVYIHSRAHTFGQLKYLDSHRNKNLQTKKHFILVRGSTRLAKAR